MRALLRIHKTFSCNLYLCYTLCLLSMLLKDDIVDIEHPDGICLPTFVLDEFS